jgi:hypothetical protein
MKHVKLFENFMDGNGNFFNSGNRQSKLVAITQDDWLYVGVALESFIQEAQKIIAGARDLVMQEVTHLAVMDNYSGENYLIVSSKPVSPKSMKDSEGAGHYFTPSNEEMEVDGNLVYQCVPILDNVFYGINAGGSENEYSEEEILNILEISLK